MQTVKKFSFILIVFCFLFLSIFSFIPYTDASMYGKITGNEVRLRSLASTSGEVLDYLSKGEYVIVTDTNKVSGEGCSFGWYKVEYSGKSGFICGQYIELKETMEMSYSRPWTSPKKAIMGGAEFISSGYISAGQFTSYLKKFNVNPNSSYKVNNHQYMANLEAPFSEAKTTYNSYKANDLLKLPFHFTIPVFENMPENTKHSAKGVKTGGTSEVKDQEFEKKLEEQGFPESYRKWLRVLHESYPNWTFEALKTGLDFQSTALIQKSIGSIQLSSCSECIDEARINTEGNWYIANIETVSYYLDPRNFLEDTSIFMFEDLSYKEIQTEEVVKSILSNTFMNGVDPIDKISYSSIFMEAGKTYNVSPVYLASLSRQEVGTKLGTVTSGERFTYKGQTYEGFYNFYNIGAYSSEANPALAGLVYAAGGASKNSDGIYVGNIGGGTFTPDKNVESPSQTVDSPSTPKEEKPSEPSSEPEKTTPSVPEVTPVATHLNNMDLHLKSTFLTNLQVQTTVQSLKNKTVGQELTFKKANGSPLGDSEIITTGCTVSFSTGENYTFIIYGDISGDGIINSADLLKMRQYLLGQLKLEGAYFESAKLANTDQVNSADLLRLRQYLLGQKGINQA